MKEQKIIIEQIIGKGLEREAMKIMCLYIQRKNQTQKKDAAASFFWFISL